VIELPDSATFAAVIADPRFYLGVFVALLSGVVRGFSGFGAALTYMPLMSAIYGPQLAAPSFLLIDCATGLVLTLSIRHKTDWHGIVPPAAAAMLAVQFGTLILQYADPTALRWAMAGLVIAVVVILASGWRYHGRPLLAVTLGAGLLSGLMSGAMQMAGPPIILCWLGSAQDFVQVRANFIAYFALLALGAVVTYLAHGLLSPVVIAMALVFGPLHVVAMWAGSGLFNRMSERSYRWIAYVIVAGSALISLPVFDRWMH
jgi:uncharacterized membrane protein YfcA